LEPWETLQTTGKSRLMTVPKKREGAKGESYRKERKKNVLANCGEGPGNCRRCPDGIRRIDWKREKSSNTHIRRGGRIKLRVGRLLEKRGAISKAQHKRKK